MRTKIKSDLSYTYEVLTVVDSIRKTLAKTIGFMFLCFFLIFVSVIVLVVSKQKDRVDFFTVNNKGQIINRENLTMPLSDDEVVYFATQTLIDMFSFDYVNSQTQIRRNLDNLTTASYKLYLKEVFKPDGLQDVVKSNSAVLKSRVSGKVKIINAGVGRSGRYTWEIVVPLSTSVYANIGHVLADRESTYKVVIVRESAMFRPKRLVMISVVEVANEKK